MILVDSSARLLGLELPNGPPQVLVSDTWGYYFGTPPGCPWLCSLWFFLAVGFLWGSLDAAALL